MKTVLKQVGLWIIAFSFVLLGAKANAYELQGGGRPIDSIALYPEGIFYLSGVSLNMTYAGIYRLEGDTLILSLANEDQVYQDCWEIRFGPEGLTVAKDNKNGLLQIGDINSAVTANTAQEVPQAALPNSVRFPELEEILNRHHIELPPA